MDELDRLVGEWSMVAAFDFVPPPGIRGHAVIEWMPGRRFLVQRWEVDHPEAPDGIAIIGFDESRGTYLQHYFDTRGVARLYEMSLVDDVWTLSRTEPDFSPLDFSQRFIGTFSDDGRTIAGRWEKSEDGTKWELDFELTYSLT